MAGLQDISPMVAKLWVTSAVRAHARGRGGGLAAGMAAADDDDVEAPVHGPYLSALAAPVKRPIVSRESKCFT